MYQLESISPKQRTSRINLALAQLYQRTGGNDRSAVTAYKEVLRSVFVSLYNYVQSVLTCVFVNFISSLCTLSSVIFLFARM